MKRENFADSSYILLAISCHIDMVSFWNFIHFATFSLFCRAIKLSNRHYNWGTKKKDEEANKDSCDSPNIRLLYILKLLHYVCWMSSKSVEQSSGRHWNKAKRTIKKKPSHAHCDLKFPFKLLCYNISNVNLRLAVSRFFKCIRHNFI